MVQDLSVATGEREFTKGRFVFHVARFFASQPACTRATVKPRLLVGTGLQHFVHAGKGLHAFQCANGGEDDEEIVVAVAL